MCGIVGQVGIDASKDQNRAQLEAQLASLAHRGPDGHGIMIEPEFAFGHARLSIIDLESGAPFSKDSASFAKARYTT